MRSLALALALGSFVIVACSEPDEAAPTGSGAREAIPAGLVAPGALAAVLPDELGEWRAASGAESGLRRDGASATTWASRSYERPVPGDEGTSAVQVRIVDAARAPDLIVGFAAAQRIEVPSGAGGLELVPTSVGGRPALASWDPATNTSEAQVLVRGRLIVALVIPSTRAPEAAVELLDRVPLDRLEALGAR